MQYNLESKKIGVVTSPPPMTNGNQIYTQFVLKRGILVDEERQAVVGELFSSARKYRGLSLSAAAEEAGVNKTTASQVEKFGVYEGMRAIDLFKLAAYYKIDMQTVVSLLGFAPDTTVPDSLQPIFHAIVSLSATDQEWLVGVLDVLLRGMRGRS